MDHNQEKVFSVTSFRESAEGGSISRVIVKQKDERWLTCIEQEDPHETPMLDVKYSGYNCEQAVETAQLVVREKLHSGAEPLVPVMMRPFRELPAVASDRLFRHKLDAYSQSHVNPALFQELKKWRKKEASKARIAPYLVASDRLLQMLAAFVPYDGMQLIQIPGIGNRKMELYAQPLLSILIRWPQPESFPLDWVDRAVSDVEAIQWAIKLQDERKRKAAVKAIEQKEQEQYLLESVSFQTRWLDLLRYADERVDTVIGRMKQLHYSGENMIEYIEREIEQMPGGKQLVHGISETRTERPELFGDIQGLWQYINKRYPSASEKGHSINHIKLVIAYFDLLATSDQNKTVQTMG